MARKTAFINETVLKALNQQQQIVSPEQKTAASLDEEVKAVLDRKDVTARDKAELYNQILQRYLTARTIMLDSAGALSTQNTAPVNGIVRESNSDDSNSDESRLKYPDSFIIETVPPKFKQKARNLLAFMKAGNNIKWTDDGKVVYDDNNTIEDSNIVDLVNDIVRNRKHSQPTGWKEFAATLARKNIPKDLIGNPRRLNITSNNSTTVPRIVSSKAAKRARITPTTTTALPTKRKRTAISRWSRLP